MATGFNTQIGGGKYNIQFETDRKELYEIVQKVCRTAVDEESYLSNNKTSGYCKNGNDHSENREILGNCAATDD